MYKLNGKDTKLTQLTIRSQLNLLYIQNTNMIQLIPTVGLCLLALVFAGPVPKELEDVAPDIRRICMEESGVSLESIEKVAVGNFTEDDKVKCYLKCQLAHFGVITRKPSIDWKTLLRLTPPDLKDIVVKGSQVCHDIKGDDACELAFNAAKCAYANFPDMFFIM